MPRQAPTGALRNTAQRRTLPQEASSIVFAMLLQQMLPSASARPQTRSRTWVFRPNTWLAGMSPLFLRTEAPTQDFMHVAADVFSLSMTKQASVTKHIWQWEGWKGKGSFSFHRGLVGDQQVPNPALAQLGYPSLGLLPALGEELVAPPSCLEVLLQKFTAVSFQVCTLPFDLVLFVRSNHSCYNYNLQRVQIHKKA